MENSKPLRIAVRKFAPFETAMQKLWEKFCLETSCNLKVEMVPMELDDLHEAIIEKQGLKNGDWDIAHIVTDWLWEAIESGSLEDLKPYINHNPPDDFPHGWSESLLSMQQVEESIAGLPFHDGPECLIYRKDLFDDKNEQQNYLKRFGKALKVPETWDDFKTVAQFFTRPDENLYGTVFAGLPDGHNTVFDFCLQLWTRGGELTDESGLININTKAANEGLAFYKKLFSAKTMVHPKSPEYESVQTGMAFARGEAAMMVNWFGFASMCEIINESNVKSRVDIAPIPCTQGNKSASLNVYWMYTIGSGSTQKQIAYNFIRFAINQQNDKLLTMEGGIGCRVSTWKDNEVNATIPYYCKLEDLHRDARSLPQKATWSQIAKIIDEVVLMAVNTDIPIEQLLEAGQLKINALDKRILSHANTL